MKKNRRKHFFLLIGLSTQDRQQSQLQKTQLRQSRQEQVY